LIDIFPPQQQDQVRHQFASVLEGIISQKLIPGKKLVPACEIMIPTEGIRNNIRERKPANNIKDQIESGFKEKGSQTFDQSLRSLVQNNLISTEVAKIYCEDKEGFNLRLRRG